MSKPIAPTPVITHQITPLVNQQAVNPPTSTAQTDAQLTTTSTNGSDASEPTLSNKEALKSPLDVTVDLTTSASLVLEHSAPEARDQFLGNDSSVESKNVESQIKNKNSINVLKDAALSGDVAAQFDLGMRYYEGDGVDLDHTKASLYFQLAAAEGDANAQYSLATLFLKGEGVEKNTSSALIWYQRAANQNHPAALYNLGLMFCQGDGIPKDDTQAVNYFRNSADLGNTDAQWQLGLMYEKGQGVKRDESKAFDWYLKAAHKDNANAQFEVGRMYAVGTVVAKDDDQAFKWLSKAAMQGLHIAQIALVDFHTKSSEKNIDLYLASYQLLKSGLQPDGKFIRLFDFRSGYSDISKLVKLFPVVLVKFPEFGKVKSLVFNYKDFSDDEYSSIGELIRSNTTNLELVLLCGAIKDDCAHKLAQALEKNTSIISFTSNRINYNINDQILKSIGKNNSIARLRQHKLGRPINYSDILPLEVLEIIVDKMIVSFIKSDHSIADTIHAINEFLICSGINSITTDLEKINKASPKGYFSWCYVL
jgi:TPR repeat protein